MKFIMVLAVLFLALLLSCTFSFEQQAVLTHQKALTKEGQQRFDYESQACSLFIVAASLSPTGMSFKAQDFFFDATLFCLHYTTSQSTTEPNLINYYLNILDDISGIDDSLVKFRYSDAVFTYADTLLSRRLLFNALNAAQKAYRICDSSVWAYEKLFALNNRIRSHLITSAENEFSAALKTGDDNAFIRAEFFLRSFPFYQLSPPETLASNINKATRYRYSNFTAAFNYIPDIYLWEKFTRTQIFLKVDSSNQNLTKPTMTVRLLNGQKAPLIITRSDFTLIAHDETPCEMKSITPDNYELKPNEEIEFVLLPQQHKSKKVLLFNNLNIHIEKYLN